MGHPGQLIASAAVALSLVFNSTAAVASTTPAPAPTTHSWLTLSMLTPSGAAVLDTAAVTAAQPENPPPPPPDGNSGPGWPPIPVILIWLAVLGLDIWILTRHHHHHHPNSPD